MNARMTTLLPKARRGVAAVEFLFAAPAFFVMVFFVIEIALTWNDRHIMRLAAYRAAKTVIKTRATLGQNANLCWTTPQSGGPQDEAGARVHVAARRASAKLMATITPSITQLLTMFGTPRLASEGLERQLETLTHSDFGNAVSTVTSNPYVHAVVRMMKGLPAAWLFTDLRCTDIKYPAAAGSADTPGVEINLVYHRPAKMPYIANIMWVLHWIQHFDAADDGTSGMLHINPLTYGIDVHMNLNGQQLDAFLSAAQAKTKQVLVDTANNFKDRIGSGVVSPIPESFAGHTTPTVFGKIAGPAFSEVVGSVQSWQVPDMSVAQQTVNLIANSAINLLLSAPDELKTIPIQVSVRLPNFNQAYVNQGKEWDNNAMLIGSFTGNKKIGRLAKAMGKTITEHEKPNGSGGLPYTTNDEDDMDPKK